MPSPELVRFVMSGELINIKKKKKKKMFLKHLSKEDNHMKITLVLFFKEMMDGHFHSVS